MITLKVIDILVQLGIAIAALCLYNEDGFFLFYFGIGGWQVISTALHMLFYKRYMRTTSRKAYEGLLIILIAIAAVGGGLGFINANAGGTILYMLVFILLFVGPVMALWYFFNCIVELADAYMKTQRIKED